MKIPHRLYISLHTISALLLFGCSGDGGENWNAEEGCFEKKQSTLELVSFSKFPAVLFNEGCSLPFSNKITAKTICNHAFSASINKDIGQTEWIEFVATYNPPNMLPTTLYTPKLDQNVGSHEQLSLDDFKNTPFSPVLVASPELLPIDPGIQELATVMTNVIPQYSAFHSNIWVPLMSHIRSCAADRGDLNVLIGAVYENANRKMISNINAPSHFVVVFGDQTHENLSSFLIPNKTDLNIASLGSTLTPISTIEQHLGLSLDRNTNMAEEQPNSRPVCDLPLSWNAPTTHRASAMSLSTANLTCDVIELTTSVECGSKTTCSQMSSCDEATIYFSQCDVSSLDGDSDGIPCESICK